MEIAVAPLPARFVNKPQPPILNLADMTAVDTPATLSRIPKEVQDFAAKKGANGYLNAVIELAQRAFPSSALRVSLAQDSEDETHQYIALDVEVGSKATEELLAGQRIWSGGISRVCPSHRAVYFVLGWR